MANSSKTDWDKLADQADEDIDLSEQPELTDPFFAKAKLRVPPIVLENAVVDGINRFIQDGLIHRGLLDPGRYESDPGLSQLKHDIARAVADSWKTSGVS